jgi:glycosyltransferase involved in cell wall biosynthesis
VKNIIITVINDLVTDQRVHRMAGTMVRLGYQVQLVGRKLPGSLPVDTHIFRIKRFRMLFRKGPLFYAFYNMRLFFFLLFRRRPVMLVSVDLDTLAAGYLVSRLRRIPILYDSHEYFTEVPELVDRPHVKRTWEFIEGRIVPRLRAGIAVSDSIAEVYRVKYGVEFRTIRNVPVSVDPGVFPELHDTYPSAYKLIYQGALNRGRGIELMIEAMRYVPDTMLFTAGDGDIRTALQSLVHRLKLTDRVVFPGRIPPRRLVAITAQCDIGFSLEEDLGLNYRLALPNKIFDYIQARVPVLCSDLPEMAALVQQYGVGEVCRERSPQALAGQVREILKNVEKQNRWKEQLDKAARELCWEREEQKLVLLVEELTGKG